MPVLYQKEVKAVSDSRQPHRRRRPQVVLPEMEPEMAPEITGEEKLTQKADVKPQEIPRELRRIVVTGDDEPDWMVSANRISGAAERRGAPTAKAAQQEEKKEEKKAARQPAFKGARPAQTKQKAAPAGRLFSFTFFLEKQRFSRKL